MRTQIWEYLRNNHQCLIALAEEIAHGVDPHPSRGGISLSGLTDKTCQFCAEQRCPKPINYLANGECPSSAPHGLAGKLKVNVEGSLTCLSHSLASSLIFNGCNFQNLVPLALAKGSPIAPTDEQLRGFNIQNGRAGLSILLGPWSDFCLWCWSLYPSNACPILILSKDNSPFAEEKAIAGNDWGVDQVNEIIKSTAVDSSSKNLFGALKEKAEACLDGEGKWIQYIGENRIFIYNVWPWFRCGQQASGDDGIHRNLSRVPCIWNWLDALNNCLKPRKIAALGGWSDPIGRKSDDWLRQQSSTLEKFPKGNIKVFSHPSTWHRSIRKVEREAFKDFLSCPPPTPASVLNGGVDG